MLQASPLALWFAFTRAVKRLEDANEGARSGWATSLYKAARSVGQHPTRIRTAQQLKAVHGIGDFTTKVRIVAAGTWILMWVATCPLLVSEVLWHEFPPGDPDSEEEQLEDEVRQAAALAPAALTGGGRGRGRGKRAAAGSAAAAAAAALGPHDIPFGDTLVVPVAGADGGDAPAGGIGSGRTRSRGGGGGSGRGAGRGAGRGKRLVAVANAGSDGNGSGDDVVALAPANLNNGSLRLGVYGAGGGLGATAAAGTYGAYGSGVMDGDTAGSGVTVQGVVTAAPERKRARRQSGGPDGAGLAYAPNPGTANYAFLIVMYMVRVVA
ncbi:hypothetical protein VOLCADRAFT_119097 [Volvox carteri f. nagariensis]|uniref:Uncharacterized protein n=1 Tax=Volvox carteri f. nagariensis TaxID=3068 RepID=D8UA03_VOLCA|nr:uncharacterized protein VOLCADRAFT_119097 [Volvox carteri f. nagariensis]EFJ43562.1 hypothetical protein VOLCADRAFT_119097 [Volvox carteri f. nagariensis]|eukprot:XP_002955491.1 hypothetical protein VOLCADRAFT_119097 [Volvox carteri f. nagariensis]